jgi:hypothetical protein
LKELFQQFKKLYPDAFEKSKLEEAKLEAKKWEKFINEIIEYLSTIPDLDDNVIILDLP